jgi:hypothetical protein
MLRNSKWEAVGGILDAFKQQVLEFDTGGHLQRRARRAAGMWIFAFSADDGRRASLISKSILCYGRSLQQLG